MFNYDEKNSTHFLLQGDGVTNDDSHGTYHSLDIHPNDSADSDCINQNDCPNVVQYGPPAPHNNILIMPTIHLQYLSTFLTDAEYARLRSTSYALHGSVDPQYRLQYACCFYDCVTHYADQQWETQKVLCSLAHRDSDGDDCMECCVQGCICVCCILDLPVTIATQTLRWPVTAIGTCAAFSCGSCLDAKMAIQEKYLNRDSHNLPPERVTMA